MSARVHQITHRHHEEVGLNLYTRRLDKIYTELGKSPMLPKVIKKMREEYSLNPHDFYLKVCQKYGITPGKKIDAYRLVYGKTQFGKYDFKGKANRDGAKSESKGAVGEVKEEEPPTPEEKEDPEEEGEEEESEVYVPSKEETRFKFNTPDQNDGRSSPRNERSFRLDTSRSYHSFAPEDDSTSPRRNTGLNSVGHYQSFSPENEHSSLPSSYSYVQSLPPVDDRVSPRDDRVSPREALGSPRIGSPRAHYRIDDRPVEQLDYVNVVPGNVVETMVLTGKKGDQETGFWIPARILTIDMDKEVMDVQVLHPIKYGLATKAVGVPYRYIRKPANIIWDTMLLV